jgi:hypothetical protein
MKLPNALDAAMHERLGRSRRRIKSGRSSVKEAAGLTADVQLRDQESAWRCEMQSTLQAPKSSVLCVRLIVVTRRLCGTRPGRLGRFRLDTHVT